MSSEWKRGKLKYFAILQTGNSISDSDKDLYSEEIYGYYPYIATKDIDVTTNKINYDNGLYIPIDTGFKIANKNTILLCIEGGSAGRKIGYLDRDVCYVNKLCNFKPNHNINSRYLYYSLQSYFFTQQFNLNLTGIIPGVSVEKIKNMFIKYPDIHQQQKIANFLDEKVSQIDTIIEKTKQSIEELKKYKQSLITETVTKGLNPDVEMKDTGINWLGNIPIHWKVIKIRNIFEIKKDIANKLGYNVLSVTQQGLKIKDIESNEGQLSSDYSKYQIVEINDFVMNHMDLLTGWVDCSKYVGVTSPDYRVFRFKNNINYNHDYFKYLLQVCYLNRIFYAYGHGVSNLGRWRLPTDEFLNFYVPVPNVDEQDKIADFLNKKLEIIDRLVRKKEEMVKEMEKYKKSLIYEYVTGKKEVM
ncbi:restriction endonuclease subunit S [Heyndrickxia coagulans]|uniref:restriction endonuclease subunit S n=1 Tax=Heyndrickxia coagulans TaxID=1398 RepID=UPI0003139E80|nr:restriction endonuclease subunit S [Heyndrickxia coagulans]